MSCRDFAEYDARLRELTFRRNNLSRAEWAELYGIVVRVLSAERLDIHAALPGTPEDYIHDYFQDRIFRQGPAGSRILHTCALTRFYLQYLQNRLNREHVDNAPPYDAGNGELPERIDVETAHKALALWQQGDQDAETVSALTDLVAQAVQHALSAREPDASAAALVDDLQRYMGLRVSAIVAAAFDFLFASGPWTGLAGDAWWIRLYLRRHQCSEPRPGCPDDGGPEPLSALRTECRVQSYHHKAIKLGVAVPKGGDAAYAAFANSYRGQWLVSLGVPVDRAHRTEMAIALKILCVAALSGQGGPATDNCGRLLS
jgi:hypothetical protein